MAGAEAAVGSGDGLAFGVLADGAADGLVFFADGVDLLAVLFEGFGFAAGGAFFWLATDFEKKEKRLPCFSDLAFFAGGAMVKPYSIAFVVKFTWVCCGFYEKNTFSDGCFSIIDLLLETRQISYQ